MNEAVSVSLNLLLLALLLFLLFGAHCRRFARPVEHSGRACVVLLCFGVSFSAAPCTASLVAEHGIPMNFVDTLAFVLPSNALHCSPRMSGAFHWLHSRLQSFKERRSFDDSQASLLRLLARSANLFEFSCHSYPLYRNRTRCIGDPFGGKSPLACS